MITSPLHIDFGDRASAAGPRVWNYLPSDLNIRTCHTAVSDSCRTYFFIRTVEIAARVTVWPHPFKCALEILLLTYLLTYLLGDVRVYTERRRSLVLRQMPPATKIPRARVTLSTNIRDSRQYDTLRFVIVCGSVQWRIGLPRVLKYYSSSKLFEYYILLEYSLLSTSGCKFIFHVVVLWQSIE